MALAERVREILPEPLTARAISGRVSVYAGAELIGASDAASIVDEDDDRPFGSRLETAVRAVLSGVQDSAMRYLRAEWPTDDAGGLALPGARVEGGQVSLWYGASEENFVIKLRPVQVHDLTEPPRHSRH